MSRDGYQLFVPQNPCRCCGIEKTSGINLYEMNSERTDKLARNLSLFSKKVSKIVWGMLI